MLFFFSERILLSFIEISNLPLKNTEIEVVRHIYFKNNSSDSSTIRIKTSKTTAPTLLNYKSSLLSEQIYIDGSLVSNDNDVQLTISANSRKDMHINYTYNIIGPLDKKDLSFSEKPINYEVIDYEKSLVKIDDNIKRTAQEITNANDNNNKKFLEVYRYVVHKMRYTYNYMYAHKGAISALETSKGLCEDTASLFVALSQSANIPCKLNVGLLIDHPKELTDISSVA